MSTPSTRDAHRSRDAQQERAELQAFADALVAAARARRPEGAGAVALAVQRPDEEPVLAVAGRTVTFEADGRELAPDDPRAVPVTDRTLFDLASVTKVVTTLTAATLIEDGLLDPASPAATHLPAGAVPDPRITVRHLLTHTSGLPAVMPLWRLDGTREERLRAIGEARLHHEPGTHLEYSCIGFIVLGRILEAITGTPLPELARERVLSPAGAHDVTWQPTGADRDRAAATEHMSDPPRGLVQGEVHDETAWSIGGVGNAGAFAGIAGALALARVLAGAAGSPRLSPAVRRFLTTDQLGDAVPAPGPWRQAFGLRIGHALPDGSVLPGIAWHGGFTGTAVWGDPATGTAAAMLTNRVHPRRDRFDGAAMRAEFSARFLAR